ncbi:diguanylate cyclase [Acinetobacter sp. ANC 4805]|uniref:GGDEF domain-containing protein n=1 Tax=Acinetobacter sp. ANC 4805 TaxID=2923425 RepID=UPI001F4B533E|nr:diguanylate cyclase [Acinetobacter sp. ANC 4805]MCH7310553.1 diguanylate cyclase [Acinetobacter sp. ANC 4805]
MGVLVQNNQNSTNSQFMPQTLADAHLLLTKSPCMIFLPKELRAHFLKERQKQFITIAKLGWPLLVCMLVGEITIAHVFYRGSLLGQDHVIWDNHFFTCAVVLFVGVVFAHIPKMASSFQIWLGLLIVIVLLDKLYIALALKNIQLVQYHMGATIMIVVIDMLALRLTTSVATFSCLTAGFFAWFAAHKNLNSYDLYILLYFFTTVAICGAIALLVERQDKLLFLHKIVLLHQVEAQEDINNELSLLSQIDGLSGLANRRYFDEILELEWNRGLRDKMMLSIIFIDIDYFKIYNDTYGHIAGDECIKKVSSALGSIVIRSADLIARYGGEEFIVLLPNTELEGAIHIAEQMLSVVDRAKIPHKGSLILENISVSIGVASCIPLKSIQATDLINAADMALYQAKSNGRHQVCGGR